MSNRKNTRSRASASTPFATGLEYYLKMGWSWLIPVDQDKTPRVSGHHGRDGKRPTATELRDWPHWFGKLNIALVLPRSVVGIDVDAYPPKPGAESLARLEDELGPLPSAPISTSRWPEDRLSGIRLFRVPGWYANYQDWPRYAGPGIDFICWYQRYVVVPPSIHASGRQYKWIRDGEPLHESMRLDRLEFLPADWCEYLAGEARSGDGSHFSRYNGRARSWLIRYASGEMCPYISNVAPKWLADLRSAEVGTSRHNVHDTAVGIASGAVKATAEGHTGANTALWPIREAFIDIVTSRPRTARRRSEQEAVAEWRGALDTAVKSFGGCVCPNDDVCDEWMGLT